LCYTFEVVLTSATWTSRILDGMCLLTVRNGTGVGCRRPCVNEWLLQTRDAGLWQQRGMVRGRLTFTCCRHQYQSTCKPTWSACRLVLDCWRQDSVPPGRPLHGHYPQPPSARLGLNAEELANDLVLGLGFE